MCTRCQDTTKGHYAHCMQCEWTTQKCEYSCTTYFVSKAGCDAIHCSSSFTMENFLRHGENYWRLPAITARESPTPSEWGSFASHKELKFYHNRSKWSFGCQCDNMTIWAPVVVSEEEEDKLAAANSPQTAPGSWSEVKCGQPWLADAFTRTQLQWKIMNLKWVRNILLSHNVKLLQS